MGVTATLCSPDREWSVVTERNREKLVADWSVLANRSSPWVRGGRHLDAEHADEKEVRIHEEPQDDVPGEYLG